MNRLKISIILFLFALLISGRVFSQSTNYNFSASGSGVTVSGSLADYGGVSLRLTCVKG